MKSILYTLLCASFLFLFTACEQEDEPIPAEKVSRTVVAYIMADNSLTDRDDLAEKDINEMILGMEQVDASQYNLLVYVDKYRSAPVLYHIHKDKKGKVIKESVKEYDEHVSTDPAIMQDVLKRSFAEYPAESYGLVLWSHGEGWIPNPLSVKKDASTRWIGQDTTGETTYLNIADLTSVLSNLPHFDFILIDACFGQAIEVAYEFRHYTDYIIGSPTEIPGPGAPYEKVVPAMFAQSNVGIGIGQAYYELYADTYTGVAPKDNDNWTGGVSIAVIKCDALDELASITNQTLKSVELNTLLNNTYDYDQRSKRDASRVGYYDMKQLMQQLSTDMNAWTIAMDNAIVYWKTTPKNSSGLIDPYGVVLFNVPQEETCGMSHYIPKSLNSPAAAAYRSTAWYKDAGLSKLGW